MVSPQTGTVPQTGSPLTLAPPPDLINSTNPEPQVSNFPPTSPSSPSRSATKSPQSPWSPGVSHPPEETPPKKFNKKSQQRHWHFTFHSYTEEDVTQIKTKLQADLDKGESKRKVKAAIFGREVCPTTGRRHLQGYIGFYNPTRQKEIFNLLGYEIPRFWMSPHDSNRGPAIKMYKYCMKAGPDKVFKIGTDLLEEAKRKKNTRKDFGKTGGDEGELVKRIQSREIKTMAQVWEEYPQLAFSHEEKIKNRIIEAIPPRPIPDHPLRPWQEKLRDKWAESPNNREVIFVVDPKGNAGKSWFSAWHKAKNPTKTLIVGADKRDNITYQAKNHIAEYGCPDFFIMDAPRSRSQYIAYAWLEEVKDARCRSVKYCPINVNLEKDVHVTVMTNSFPSTPQDSEGLSSDRYVYLVIDNEGYDGEWKYGYIDPKNTNCYETVKKRVASVIPNSLQSAFNSAHKKARTEESDHERTEEDVICDYAHTLRRALNEWENKRTKELRKQKKEAESKSYPGLTSSQ